MHAVVKAHVDGFQKSFELAYSETKAFEAFLNYAVLRSFSGDPVEPDSLIYDGADPGIDGILVFVDQKFVSTLEEVELCFEGKRRDLEVTVVFTQAKTSESWKKAEINTFESAIGDFLALENVYPHDEYLNNHKLIFNKVISYVGKIKDGKPKAQMFFATTARKAEATEIIAAAKVLEQTVRDTGFFSTVEVELLGSGPINFLADHSIH